MLSLLFIFLERRVTNFLFGWHARCDHGTGQSRAEQTDTTVGSAVGHTGDGFR